MTSTIAVRQIDWTRYGVVYAGTQDQMGPAGVVITIVRNDLIGKHRKDTPTMLQWETYTKAPNGFPVTPSCWSIYMCGLNLEYMINLGGVPELNARTKARSELLYRFIDKSNGYYSNNVDHSFRSQINVPFSVCQNEELETKFLTEAAQRGLLEL